jgi:hypothetical protein
LENSEDRQAVAALKFQRQRKNSAQNVGTLDWVDHMWQYGEERWIFDECAPKDHGNLGIVLREKRRYKKSLHL